MGCPGRIMGISRRPRKNIWYVYHFVQSVLFADRGTADFDFQDHLSRAPSRDLASGTDTWGLRTSSTFKVTGRHVLNMWRIIRAEYNLSSCTIENVVQHILRRRYVIIPGAINL